MAKIQLRKLFKDDEILVALQNNETVTAAARELSVLRDVVVSSQILGYWKRQLETLKKDGTPYATPTNLNKAIRRGMKLRDRNESDDDRKIPYEEDNSRVLFIPDQHAPYVHPDAVQFLSDVADVIDPTRVVNLGDEVDNHGLSMHDSDPNLDSAGMELSRAKIFLKDLAERFPIMDVCHSNHGSLVYRRAMKYGIPVEYIKAYRDILFDNNEGDGWQWMSRVPVMLPNGELLIAQHQSSGDILMNAAHERANIIEGHEHGTFETRYKKNSMGESYWATTSGCLVDEQSLAFAYGKLFPKKPVIGCTIVIDSEPHLIPMPTDEFDRYTGKLGGILGL